MSKIDKITPHLKRWGWRLLLSLGGGVLMAMAFPPFDFSQIVWIGLIPLLTLLWLRPMRFRTAFLLGWLYGMGWYCTSFSWIREVGEVFVEIDSLVFLFCAFLPLMTVYSLLPGLWAGLTATVLRPAFPDAPRTDGMTAEQKKAAWSEWGTRDLLSTLRAAISCGALWVVIEWLRGHGTLGFSWCSMGTALYDGLAFAQWAEFVGSTGLAIIPCATAIVLWCSIRRTVIQFKGTGKGCRPWDFYGTVGVLMLLYITGLSLSTAYSAPRMLRKDSVLPLPVVAVQCNIDQVERIDNPVSKLYYDLYLRETYSAFSDIQQEWARLAYAHPEVGITQQLPVWVIWPESALGSPIYREEGTGKYLSKPLILHKPTGIWYTDSVLSDYFLSEHQLPLLRTKIREMGGHDFVLFAGVDEHLLNKQHHKAGQYNSMLCMPGDFSTITTVSKQHLMPFGEYIPLTQEIEWVGEQYTAITGTQVGEGIRPGTGSTPLTVPVPGTDESVGVIPAICYEDTVAHELTKFARKGPQVIVNVSNDAWFRESVCGEQQARAAAFRCIELRRPMVRAANMGVTCSIAPNGAIIDQLKKGDGSPHLRGHSFAVLPVDLDAGLTLYAIAGDWFCYLCFAIVLANLIYSMVLKWRKTA